MTADRARWFYGAARQAVSRNGARGHESRGRSPVNPAPSTLEAPPGSRPLHSGMRNLLGAFAVLTALATGG
jgi:hypothetical protein